MAERWFLKIDGIAGESTNAAHKGEIDVDSWTWGLSRAAAGGAGSGGGGSGAGKASFDDFVFVARVSAASPRLLEACATGSHIKQATLSGARSSGASKGGEYLRYQLSDVIVMSVQQFGGDDEAATEQFTLTYSKVEVAYTPRSTSGKVSPPVTFGYDIKANKKL